MISLIDQPLPQWLRTRYAQAEVGIEHAEFSVHDDEIEDILAVMAQACDPVHESLDVKKEGVLVHCGLGRVGAAAWLLGIVRLLSVIGEELKLIGEK